jgi:hypothetical protein
MMKKDGLATPPIFIKELDTVLRGHSLHGMGSFRSIGIGCRYSQWSFPILGMAVEPQPGKR